MRDSEQIVKRFSMRTYLKDKQGRAGIAPVCEFNRLLKSIMEELVESDPDTGQEDWARYFLKSSIESPKIYPIFSLADTSLSILDAYLIYLKICNELLFNYLQPVCWQAASKINNSFKAAANINLHYPLEECFILASVASYRPTKIFRRFDFKSSSSLDAYALNALKRIIKNQIAKELKSKSLKLSDNGLLRSLGKKELEKALTDYGLQLKQIELSGLAWQSFKDLFEEIYPPTSSDGSRRKNFPTTPLNDRQLSQIAARYNQQLRRLEIHTQPANGQEIKKILATCIEAVRVSKTRHPVSLEDYSTGEVADLVSNPFEGLIQQEKQEELTQLKNVILQEFKALDKIAQNSLILWLGLGINQQDFLPLLKLKKQYQVARQFQAYQKTILKSVVKFGWQNYLHKNLTEKEINQIINENLDRIKEYLSSYSRHFFGEILAEILTHEIDREEKLVLQDYFEGLNEYLKAKKTGNQIARRSLEVDDRYLDIKQKLITKFIHSLEESLKISLNQFKTADKSIVRFIENYLQDNRAILY